MKILVTGGAGYIGSFMVKRLLDEGHAVIVADSLERGFENAVGSRASLKKGDLSDPEFLKSLFSSDTIDAIIHFAAYISVNESVEHPHMYFSNNTHVALELLEAAREHKVKNFIFSSTAAVYGNPVTASIPEDHQKNPESPYGESKLMVEQMLKWYQRIYGLNFVALRYFNACGGALDGSMGEAHSPETHIIPRAIHAALQNEEFSLFGNDYKTPDGTCVRDYIHVIDLVDAHILALKKLEKDKGAFYYNVGTGTGYSNKEVIEMVKKVSGVNVNVLDAKRRPGDPDTLVADNSRIVSDLGFAPKYSDLETIVRSAWEWHKKNLESRIKNSE